MEHGLSTTFPVELPRGRVITVHMEYDLRGKIEHLAIVVRLVDGTELARLDTSHGELHTHYYGQDGQLGDLRKVVCPLPDDPGARADLLHDRYEELYLLMMEAAEGRAP